MKPTKNRIFCYGCNKNKMLFETKSKADNFIKYNGEDILEETGKSPIRSYYCDFCGGFHVTSISSPEIGERLDRSDKQVIRRLEASIKEKERVKKAFQNLSERMAKIRSLLSFGQVTEAEDLLDIFYLELDELSETARNVNTKLKNFRNEADKIQSILKDVKQIVYKSEQELVEYMAENDSSTRHYKINTILHNIIARKELERLIDLNEELLGSGMANRVSQNIASCYGLLKTLYGAGTKEYARTLKKQLQEQEMKVELITKQQ